MRDTKKSWAQRFGANLRAARDRRGLTLQKLADQADSLKNTVWRIEAGLRVPSVELAARLAEALGIELAELIP